MEKMLFTVQLSKCQVLVATYLQQQNRLPCNVAKYRVGKYRDIFENIEKIRFLRHFRYISSICTYIAK